MSFASRSSCSAIAVAALMGACRDFDAVEPANEATAVNVGDETAALLGGDTTVFDSGRAAYSSPARNLSSELRDAFSLGDHFFNRGWIVGPASASGNDGLGPTYNATSCSACHSHDGRGAPPSAEDPRAFGLLFRLSAPSADGPVDEPTYGGQLNPFAILGVPAEGKALIAYDEIGGTFADGEPYSLRAPRYTFDLALGPFAPGTMTSPRIAPVMIGLGLLEAISEDTLLAFADPDDRDGDGISGRANRVIEPRTGALAVGRFGWKANVATLEAQTAGAFLGDIGITTSLFPSENCPTAQSTCHAAPNGGAPELDDAKLAAIVLYARTLAVPARRSLDDATALRGEQVFATIGCGSCHQPQVVTGTFPGVAAISGQTIRPFTDLLLHDMGPALADGRPDGLATGSEWRTPPLWGIGLLHTVSKHTFLLHDGRARDVKEAILWHGGEAETSRERFRALSVNDRRALLRFLETL